MFVGLIAPVQAQAASHAEQVRALVNVERKKVGLKPLALSQRYQAQADKRAKEICQRGRFNHKGAAEEIGRKREIESTKLSLSNRGVI